MESPGAVKSARSVVDWERLGNWWRVFLPLTGLALSLTALALSNYNLYRSEHSHRRYMVALRFSLRYIAAWALLFLLLWAVHVFKRRAILAGPAVTAVVKTTDVREDPRSLRQRFGLTIRYKFYVKDEPYWGFKRRFFRDPSEAETAGASLLGREVTVHYHPRNPDRSLLA